MRSVIPLLTALQLSLFALNQGPPPTPGFPYLRLVWSRIADLNGELGSVEYAEFSVDGRLLATASKYCNDISVWGVRDATLRWNTKADQEVERVAFSPNGKIPAGGGEDDLWWLFTPDGKLLKTLPQASAIDSLRWSRAGPFLATDEEDSGGASPRW